MKMFFLLQNQERKKSYKNSTCFNFIPQPNKIYIVLFSMPEKPAKLFIDKVTLTHQLFLLVFKPGASFCLQVSFTL